MFGLPLNSLLVEAFIPSDVLLFLLTFGDDLDTLGADAWLEFRTLIIDFLSTSKLLL